MHTLRSGLIHQSLPRCLLIKALSVGIIGCQLLVSQNKHGKRVAQCQKNFAERHWQNRKICTISLCYLKIKHNS